MLAHTIGLDGARDLGANTVISETGRIGSGGNDMKLDEYPRQQVTYAEFAATVVSIIEAGLSTRPDVVRAAD